MSLASTDWCRARWIWRTVVLNEVALCCASSTTWEVLLYLSTTFIEMGICISQGLRAPLEMPIILEYHVGQSKRRWQRNNRHVHRPGALRLTPHCTAKGAIRRSAHALILMTYGPAALSFRAGLLEVTIESGRTCQQRWQYYHVRSAQ